MHTQSKGGGPHHASAVLLPVTPCYPLSRSLDGSKEQCAHEVLSLLGFELQSFSQYGFSQMGTWSNAGRSLKLITHYLVHNLEYQHISVRLHVSMVRHKDSFFCTWTVTRGTEIIVTLMKWIGFICHVVAGLGTCTQSIIKYEWAVELLRVSQGFRMLQNGRV